jgi:hypothetical protein
MMGLILEIIRNSSQFFHHLGSLVTITLEDGGWLKKLRTASPSLYPSAHWNMFFLGLGNNKQASPVQGM